MSNLFIEPSVRMASEARPVSLCASHRHWPQLDSLRAFAVGAVACHHWSGPGSSVFPFFTGVTLFFVLSGFLITGILIDAKAEVLEAGGSFVQVLKNFYVRRFLRIFPLYYAVLLWGVLYGSVVIGQTWPWHASYLTNYYFIHHGGWHGEVSHFWSLAVEEQFYLIWPVVVLATPIRRLPWVLGSVFLMGPLYRLICQLAFPNVVLLELATPGSFDSLAIGALLAFDQRHGPTFGPWHLSTPKKALVVLACVSCYAVSRYQFFGFRIAGLELTFVSIAFGIFVHAAVRTVRGPIGTVLDFKPLQYLGTISYGFYLLHFFAYVPVGWVFHHFPAVQQIPHHLLPLRFACIFTLAAVSWHLFEKPINGLKRFFPYSRRHSPANQEGARACAGIAS